MLFRSLKENGMGCRKGRKYFGALSYADDICILSPSLRGLQEMLDICDHFSIEYDVKFNPTKTQCIRFSKTEEWNDKAPLYLAGQTLSWVSTIKHVGNWLLFNLSEEVEISRKRGIFYSSVNKLYSNFCNVGYKTIMKLFNSYCNSFYGAQAWNFRDKHIDDILKAWNKSVRHLCKLPYMTHTDFLPFLTNTLHIKDQLYLRALKLIFAMINSNNQSVSFLGKFCMDNCCTIIGGNYRLIMNYLQTESVPYNEARLILEKRKRAHYDKQIDMIIEILDSLDGEAIVNGFTEQELRDILCGLCVD